MILNNLHRHWLRHECLYMELVGWTLTVCAVALIGVLAVEFERTSKPEPTCPQVVEAPAKTSQETAIDEMCRRDTQACRIMKVEWRKK